MSAGEPQAVVPVAPVRPYVPTEEDPDWELVRQRVLSRLRESVGQAWTDHNAPDPGVTLAESMAFGVADLHYRLSERNLDAWPLEARGWEADPDRVWHAPLGSAAEAAPHGLAAVADLLSGGPTSAGALEQAVRAAASRSDAQALLARVPWSSQVPVAWRDRLVSLARHRWVRQVAQEQADVVAQAIAAERGSGGSVPDRDARAAAQLARRLPLWEDELAAVVRRERRRLTAEALVARLDRVRSLAPETPTEQLAALRAELEDADLDLAEVEIAIAAAEQPPGLMPEDLEDGAGRSHVWPPHPLQALTCEPVTAADYARRARSHLGVGRAWAVPGRLRGVSWNGLPVATTDLAAAAVTIVVERVADGSGDQEFLRSVLAQAVGREVRAPFPDWRVEPDEITPRRLLGDEVGAAVLARAPVLVQGVLVTDPGADRAAVVTGARQRIGAFFSSGRPGTAGPEPTGPAEGPWPRVEQPRGGWVPGEPVRFTEIVEAIVADPAVRGVEALAMKVEPAAGDPAVDFVPARDGSLAIPADAVPALAEADCLRVRFALNSSQAGCTYG